MQPDVGELPSHGRGHRIKTCIAHSEKPLVSAKLRAPRFLA